jgi:hypothetical protein
MANQNLELLKVAAKLLEPVLDELVLWAVPSETILSGQSCDSPV